MASLKESIQADMKTAMRAGDKPRLVTVRNLLAAIQRREVDERTELDDTAVLQVIEKLVKQGNDSVKQFAEGGRQDLVEKESKEVEILKAYLPEQLTEAELDHLIEQVMAKTGATGIKDMGKVMSAIRSEAQGRADMGAISARVKAKLAG